MSSRQSAQLAPERDAWMIWGVKSSLWGYLERVGSSPEGVAPAVLRHELVAFAPDFTDARTNAFAGGLRIRAHEGLMRIDLFDPCLEFLDERRLTGVLTARLGERPGDGRAAVAMIRADAETPGQTVHSAWLAAAGEAVFGGNYPEGTPLDPIVIVRDVGVNSN